VAAKKHHMVGLCVCTRGCVRPWVCKWVRVHDRSE
jgi:hypothetical protein